MLDRKGFDLWADGYDEAVGLSDEENSYPFAGYREVLGTVYQRIMEKPRAAVLDLGFGTGTLAAKLYEQGCSVFGQDFSEQMLRIASEKMPLARLCPGDLAEGLAEPLRRGRYDFITATYSLHHLTDERKRTLLRELRGLLKPGGRILIGDVAFETRADLERCRQAAGEEWDEEELYCVAEELRAGFPDLRFTGISFCAGILELAGSEESSDGPPSGTEAETGARTVRRAGEGDIPGILALLVQVNMVHHLGRPDLFKGPATKYSAAELRELLKNEQTPAFVCADEKGRILGHAFCIRKQEKNSSVLTDVRTLYIDDICVDEAVRGTRVGTELYEAVKAYARENGFYNLTLNVWVCNPGAMRFYERLGLVPQKIGMEEIL